MQIHSNIDQFIKNLERIRDAVSTAGTGNMFGEAMASAVNTARGKMDNRIFNQSRDANGESLGKYIGKTTHATKRKYRILKYGDVDEVVKKKKALRKNLKEDINADYRYTEYEKQRVAHGRQINQKDLEFSGSLRRSIETVKGENKAQIIITNPENAKIASYQERQIGNIRSTGFAKGSAAPAPIFRLSKEEYESVKEQGRILIKQVIAEIIKGL